VVKRLQEVDNNGVENPSRQCRGKKEEDPIGRNESAATDALGAVAKRGCNRSLGRGIPALAKKEETPVVANMFCCSYLMLSLFLVFGFFFFFFFFGKPTIYDEA